MVMKSVFEYLTESDEDYRGQHQAPNSNGDSPLYDVTKEGTYPEDIYTDPKAALYYGESGDNRDPEDNFNIQIIRSCRNRPNKIISKVVTAKDVWTDGNSLNEFGYDPQ